MLTSYVYCDLLSAINSEGGACILYGNLNSAGESKLLVGKYDGDLALIPASFSLPDPPFCWGFPTIFRLCIDG